MANKNYTQLAKEIVQKVGGKENIVSVVNCMTRLRFVLKEENRAKDGDVKEIKGVQGVIKQGGQYQVIIGTHVNEVIKDVQKEIGDLPPVDNQTDMKLMKDGSTFNRLFKVITGCIMPSLGVMIASGIIKGLLAVLTTVGLLTNTDGTYLILYATANAAMYFLPIIVGFNAGKVFGCNQYVTAVIGAALVYPDIIAIKDAGTAISFLKMPVVLMNYTNSLFPVILAAWFAAKVEKISKKIIPTMLQLMFVPTVTLLLAVPVAYLAIGPVMTIISNGLSAVVMAIFNNFPIFGGIVFGAFWQVMVLLGLHAAFIPVLFNNLFTLGSDPVNAILGLTVWALAGVSLGYALRIKDKEKKSMGFGNMVSCLCGVTEPTIYSIALPNFKLFIAAFIGGGISGGILAGLGGRMYSFVGDGFFRIPAMINPEGLDVSFYGFLICAAIAFIVSSVLAFVFAGKETTKKV
ncbi:hypothetical protein acsn021_03740 [Anaerocolumna cellulosilytica]|uniref:Uncharacterized protein n=1 Tax=Anaerocolumna cellulosilytica TaxID=433286 RepID=A0A6S6QZM2_9FIRM|nr:PTS transporter subunit EIIC [Anaerocolumna cellulosilytica]MBB5197363.1 PTS system beta-glucosides-specific IIC component [Anaerocolumna cellulosilytica]BCJ92805.1 hypothetical protein acsn021_03740 [Anaerocolumna cellulosilytica]